MLKIMQRRIVLAIGGNSLIRAKDKQSFADQLAAVDTTCRQIADLVQAGHQVVITHGNGPQVGFLLIRSHLARNRLPEIPLEAANAQTQGEIGYMIQQALGNELRRRGLRQNLSGHEGIGNGAGGVVTVVTQVVVNENDPAFSNPSKPVGPFYTKAEAAVLQKELGWTMQEDAGRGFRRLVPSPEPVEIVEQTEVERLLEAGFVVIACGGGGIPVVRQKSTQGAEDAGLLRGVAAVIDKDLASALLAHRINADTFIISTAVPEVYLHYGKPNQQPLTSVKICDVRRYLSAGEFAAGSMGPKVEAALAFLEGNYDGGQSPETARQNSRKERLVVITDPEHIGPALRQEAGTRITL